jgi:hypothetical protein
MPRTRRELLYAIADKVGGERGKRMREMIKHSVRLDLMERILTDEEFADQLKQAELDLPRVMANLEDLGPADPGTWGFPN